MTDEAATTGGGEDAVEAEDGEVRRLAGELTAAEETARTALAEAAALRERLQAGEEREREAAARYRELALRLEPALPPELVRGDTVAEVEATLAEARAVSERVRERIQAAAQGARVPAGAPPRGGPDLGAMSPAEKIRYGLARRD
jgi:hypothetical protein